VLLCKILALLYDRCGVIFDQVQRGLPIGPFRLALEADIPPAHLATRYLGSLRERINL
jgi:hypothetical protein